MEIAQVFQGGGLLQYIIFDTWNSLGSKQLEFTYLGYLFSIWQMSTPLR